LITVDIADDDVLHVPTAATQYFVHRRAGIGAEMKSVRHLDRLGRTLPSSFSVGTGSITNDDLDTRVATQPIGEDLGGAIVEQVNGLVRFQIEQQGPIPPLLLPQREVIYAQNARSAVLIVVLQTMKDAEQCVGADGHARFVRQPSATLAAGLQG
jgi:hypothetical protein